MKKFGVFIFMLIMLGSLFSQPVPTAIIRQVATNWLYLQTNLTTYQVDSLVAHPDSLDPLYWKVIFKKEIYQDGQYVWKENGWVIVSADSSCIPILAFCTQGRCPYKGVLSNEAADSLLSEYSIQIQEAKNNNQSNAETGPIWEAIINQTISIVDSHDIGLETPQWGGEGPYNQYCPFDDTHLHYNDNDIGYYDRSDVGCVATAVAQIINYHKHWDYRLVEEDRYTSVVNSFVCNIDSDSTRCDFPNFDRLNSYLDTLQIKYEGGAELSFSDKAALCFACGILMNMDYSSYGSGAGNGSPVYEKLNMYSQKESSNRYTSEEWLYLMKNQLIHNRPIEYHGAKNGGHAFIIYGFQTTNMNTTLNLVNWGRPWCHPEFWSLQPVNPASPYPDDHYMLIGIALNESVSQTIQLENGSTDYSGIILDVRGHDGISEIFTTENGIFEFGLPPGIYDFTIFDTYHYFNTIVYPNIAIQMGMNHISPAPIVLTLRPNIVVVPPEYEDGPTIKNIVKHKENKTYR